jgi:dTDP-4-amino-4,6-dideoxygalactose transaminase
MINVTKPFLPPREEYDKYIDGIWARNWLTNNGPLVNELELKLKDYLNVQHLVFLTNGTIAIQIAIKALKLKGEIITTPFSYVATSSSIVWEGCTPVYVDIEPRTLNIDPTQIEKAITEKTCAILATHVYGLPCDVDKIEEIAKRRNLKVIYDAAHCFGTKVNRKSIFEFGDISVTSFHATKLFHTIEGGAIFSKSADLIKQVAFLRNFGHDGPDEFAAVGINGKNSEFHAAMGLANLGHANSILLSRKVQSERYLTWLGKLDVGFPMPPNNVEWNHAYFPVYFSDEATTIKVIRELERNKIFPRRYFYPALHQTGIYPAANLPICESLVTRVVCLPLFHSLSDVEIDLICRIIIRTLRY